MLFAQLLTIVDGCIAPEPTRRLTVPHVLKSLATLQRDVAAAAPSARAGGSFGGGGNGGAGAVPPPPNPETPVYDVLAIVSALETLSVDTTAVIDAIGGRSTSSLSVNTLRGAGVPYMKCMQLKRALTRDAEAAGPAGHVTVGCLVRISTYSCF